MKADSVNISTVFSNGGKIIYLLPYFQREYAWIKENWKALLDDVFHIYSEYTESEPPEHFLGALVVINENTRKAIIPAFTLVDGQQRLTTISLILAALSSVIKETHRDLSDNIRDMLLNRGISDNDHYKLLPTSKYGDRDAYVALLSGKPVPNNIDSKIPAAYDYICTELKTKLSGDDFDPARLFVVLTTCMHVVFITLDRQERPYEIFESLNAKGKPLSQADLTRNYIALKLPEKQQEQAFRDYWSPIEDKLQEQRSVGRSRLGELTAFLRHYLAFHSGVLCNEEHVYGRFRDRIENDFKTTNLFIEELARLKAFAGYYDCLLRPKHETDPEIEAALSRLNVFEVTTAYPFLLACYDAGNRGILKRDDFLEGLRVLENYIVRRYLADEPTNYLNKMFPTLARDIDFSNLAQSLRQALMAKNYPSNRKLQASLKENSFYDKRSQTREKVCLVLDMINRNMAKGTGGYPVLDSKATIEHIMPQNLNAAWKKILGENWEEVHADYLNTLGNLTIVTQEGPVGNSTLSNDTFKEKREILEKHALLLNSVYFSRDIPQWDAQAIEARADFLWQQIMAIWPPLVDNTQIAPTPLTSKPTAVSVLGERIQVKTWRDVAFETAESIVKICDNFGDIVQHMPNYFHQEEFPNSRSAQLSNGWWLQLNLSSKAIKRFCRDLVANAGLSEDDWQVETE